MPTEPTGAAMKASELVQQRRFREAVEAYQLVASAPSDYRLAMALARAISALSSFVAHNAKVSALQKLVELCADAGSVEQKRQAQVALVDAYLSNGRAAPARPIAEELFRSAPDSLTQAARLRRVLEALGVADVDLELSLAAMSADVRGEPEAAGRALNSGVDVDRTPDPSMAIELVFANLRAEAGAGVEAGRHAAMLYELGCALEADGGRERALATFIELQSAQPEFRDVADRIVALTESSQGEGAG